MSLGLMLVLCAPAAVVCACACALHDCMYVSESLDVKQLNDARESTFTFPRSQSSV